MHFQRSKHVRTIFLKQCPRCNGDLSASRDHYGDYIHCLQCGYMSDIERNGSSAALRGRILRDNVA